MKNVFRIVSLRTIITKSSELGPGVNLPARGLKILIPLSPITYLNFTLQKQWSGYFLPYYSAITATKSPSSRGMVHPHEMTSTKKKNYTNDNFLFETSSIRPRSTDSIQQQNIQGPSGKSSNPPFDVHIEERGRGNNFKE